jgi:glutamate N-acetyltransferase/amino-acid N-acetyltransferase
MKVPQGFKVWGINCGIKNKNLDLGIIWCDDFCKGAGFFTKNANPAYSVVLSKKNVNKPVKAILVNSGNANCFSHKQGLKDTESIISKLASLAGVKKENILISSTGIIGKKLPKEKIVNKLPVLLKDLDKDASCSKKGIEKFSRSILTTDTFTKVAFSKVVLGKKVVNILGFAKGAGMIQPDMATMLSFIITDADLPLSFLKKVSRQAVDESFNSITVDGCMSTNDTVLVLSSKKVSLKKEKELNAFSKGLKKVCLDLAKMIVKDGEGASKFIEVCVKGAKTKEEAEKSGFAIANSNLFKCAVYGSNANWGRILCALGQAGVKVSGNISIKATDLKKKEVKITIDLKRGKFESKVYTSDLTPEYVKINAEYS